MAKNVYFILMALAFVASIAAYRHRKYVLFIPLLGLAFVVELIREIFVHESPYGRILGLYQPAEYALLTLIIANFIYSERNRQIMRNSLFVVVPAMTVVALFFSEYKHMNIIIQSPFICAWTILYLFETANRDGETDIAGNPMFWISLANLLFYAGSFLGYGFGDYLVFMGNKDLGHAIYWIPRVLNLVLYALYIIGFICLLRKKSYS